MEPRLSERLGYTFRNTETLTEALTHASYANESAVPYHNERLEYLGDAVLELCVSEILFLNHPDFDEGRLTKDRSYIVREEMLAKWARALDIAPLLRLGKGLEMQHGRENASVLADAMEAILGAVFLDGGYDAAHEVVGRLMANGAQKAADLADCADRANKDAKSRLQERLQAMGDKPPTYTLLRRTGPDHAATFEVELRLADGKAFATGRGNSIKNAEFAAAENALADLNQSRSQDGAL